MRPMGPSVQCWLVEEDMEENQELIPAAAGGTNPQYLEGQEGKEIGEETKISDPNDPPPLVPRLLAADGQTMLHLQVIEKRSQCR